MLYFAYGSNLDIERMLNRCPSAYVVGKARLKGYKLVFMENNGGRVVANILKVKSDKNYVEGIVYHINYKEIGSLDLAEGHPFVYERHELNVRCKNKTIEVWTYIMESTYEKYTIKTIGNRDFGGGKKIERKYGVPSEEYLGYIIKGYKDFELNFDILDRAIESSAVKEIV